MKLFDNDARWTTVAHAIANEVHAALKPIFTRYFDIRYSPRELVYIFINEVSHVEVETILSNDAKRAANNG